MAIKLGVIGSGGIAVVHMQGITQKKDYQVVAACDLMPGRAEEFSKKFNIPHAYTDLDKFFENESLDAVLVCTPNYAHKDPTVRALEAGIHVYCEKPMAMNVAECEAMVAAARKSKGILTIGHHMRFKPDSQYIQKLVKGGDLGEVYFARTTMHRRGGVPWWGAFHIKEKSGGGAMIDIGVHVIDLALWEMGSPTPVQVVGQTYAKLARQKDGSRPNQDAKKADEFDVDDFASAFVRMSNGATLAIECSWAANRGPAHEQTLDLYGDKGGVSLNPLTLHTQQYGQYVDIAPTLPKGDEPHAAATAHFAKVIRGEAENVVKPEQSLNVQKILDGIYRSSATGEAVTYQA